MYDTPTFCNVWCLGGEHNYIKRAQMTEKEIHTQKILTKCESNCLLLHHVVKVKWIWMKLGTRLEHNSGIGFLPGVCSWDNFRL